MTRCWRDEPTARPSFADVCDSIGQIVDTAEHLPLPGKSHSPVAPGTPGQQPSPTYSNCSFDADDSATAHLYKNCMTPSSPETSAIVD